MKLQAIKNAVTSRVGKQMLVASKHSPKILFVAGVVGVGATVVLACRATLKVDSVLANHEAKADKIDQMFEIAHSKNYTGPEYTDRDKQRDKVVVYSQTILKFARLYAPAIAMGSLSIAALTGAHITLTRRNVALTAAYTALDKGFREYRERVLADVGPEKEREYRYEMEERTIVEETEEGPVTKVIKQVKKGSIYARLFDEINSTCYRDDQFYNSMWIRTQQNWANDMLRAKGYLFLNDVYEMLGFQRSREGQVVGWVFDSKRGDNFVDFGVFEGPNVTEAMRFIHGDENAVWLDFNVDGVILDQI